MGRIFLSHSSADKEFVEPIADLLGKTKCVYDKYTFEIGMKTFDEIFQNVICLFLWKKYTFMLEYILVNKYE